MLDNKIKTVWWKQLFWVSELNLVTLDLRTPTKYLETPNSCGGFEGDIFYDN